MVRTQPTTQMCLLGAAHAHGRRPRGGGNHLARSHSGPYPVPAASPATASPVECRLSAGMYMCMSVWERSLDRTPMHPAMHGGCISRPHRRLSAHNLTCHEGAAAGCGVWATHLCGVCKGVGAREHVRGTRVGECPCVVHEVHHLHGTMAAR